MTAEWLDIRNSPLYGIIVTAIIAAVLGVFGYLIATRRVRQPFLVFMGKFGIAFFLLFFLEYAVLLALPSFHASIQNFTASLVSGILSLANASHSVSGSTITMNVPYLVFNIDVACLGGMLLWVYTALVVAEPNLTNKQRVQGIVFGLIVLVGFNFLRIFLSIYLEWLTGFQVHTLFYFFNMVFVLLTWALWLRSFRFRPSKLARSHAN